MKESNAGVPTRFILLGILAVLVILLVLPTPVHDWFVDTEVNGIPVKTLLLALVILFTPPTILANIMNKYDVDFEDEQGAQDSSAPHLHNIAPHTH